MNDDLSACEALERAVLRLYKRAVTEGRCAVAEHLLCALEELAKTHAERTDHVDRAYLTSASRN